MWGVSLAAIEKNYGKIHKDNILQQAQKHLDQKTIKLENDHLFITAKGHFLVDGISADLFLLKV
mgnify:FL=1